MLEAERALPYERRCEIYIQRLKKAYSAWVEQAKASKGVAYNLFPKFIAPKCDEDLLEDPAVRDELLARRGYAREIRNRYAGGVPDAGDDRVRAAGRAHGGNIDISPQVDRAVDRGDCARGDTPR